MISTLLIKSLRRILGAAVGSTFLKSGNILNHLQDMGEDVSIELADTYYNRVAKEKEVFEKGYLIGRQNRTKKPVYRIEYPPNILYFIGTEAEVLRKLAAYSEGKGEDKDKDKETKEGIEKDFEVDLAKTF